MADTTELAAYLKKLKKLIESADLTLFGSTFVNKKKIDDILCCIIAIFPDSFKSMMKKRVSVEVYPSVASFNRLSSIIRQTIFLSKNHYVFNKGEALVLLKNICQNIDRDISKLESISE